MNEALKENLAYKSKLIFKKKKNYTNLFPKSKILISLFSLEPNFKRVRKTRRMVSISFVCVLNTRYELLINVTLLPP